MSPARPKVSDDDILVAAQRAMTRKGPHELTLADIAEEAGVSAGRLVQRFGSKRQLLLTLSAQFGGGPSAVFSGLRAAHPAPLDTIRAYATCMGELAATPEALARNLAYLQIDLTDPEFRVHQLANARGTRREIGALLRAAVREGTLRSDTDVRALARTIETVINGALMTWACYQDGPAPVWIRREVDAVLRPHLVPTTARRNQRKGHRRGADRAVSGRR